MAALSQQKGMACIYHLPRMAGEKEMQG